MSSSARGQDSLEPGEVRFGVYSGDRIDLEIDLDNKYSGLDLTRPMVEITTWAKDTQGGLSVWVDTSDVRMLASILVGLADEADRFAAKMDAEKKSEKSK